jgi:hypothetical protein
VLDPFCGSGTVAVEASINGLQSYAADANPIARLLTRVKTEPYDTAELLEVAGEIMKQAKRFRTAPHIPIINEDLWYSPDTKCSLERLLRSINLVHVESVREFFQVCFSATARRVSLADPAISVPVRLRVKPSLGLDAGKRIAERLAWLKAVDVLEEFANICLLNIGRVSRTNGANARRTRVLEVGTDARALKSPLDGCREMESESVPLVVTSPPYGSAQKYVRAASLSLNWLGLASPKELTHLEARTIGREHLPDHSPGTTATMNDEIEAFLKSIKKVNAQREAITRTYLAELSQALREIARVLKQGGRSILVVGNNSVCGKVLETDAFIKAEMERNGLTTELLLVDDIKSRGLLTKRRGSTSVISRETILVFRRL